ncbi:MAG: GAF domain-containing protein [Armatimonadetes bacterium]|nr:GAF domain-containing protein [Armatimonadota bacterium]
MSRGAPLRAAIHRLTEAVQLLTPARDVCQMVVEEARRLTSASRAGLCLFTVERDMLDYVAVAGENALDIVGLRIKVADSLSEPVIKTGQPLLLDRRTPLETGDLFAPLEAGNAAYKPAPRWTSSEAQSGPRSAAVVPVMSAGRTIGTLSALNKVDSTSGLSPFPAFDQEDIDNLALLTEFVSLSQKVETTARTAYEQGRELTVLYQATQTVSSSLSVQKVMEEVLEAICAHLEHHSAVFFLLNDDHTHLFIAAERGLSSSESEVQLSVDSGIHAQALQSGQPMLIEDTDACEDFVDISERTRALSVMYAPIRSREESHGLLIVTSFQRNAYHSDDLKLLSAAALQAGIAIENAWLYEDAQHQAEEANALYELSQHVNESLQVENVLNFVADSTLELLKADKFALLLRDPKTDRLVPQITRNLDPVLAFGTEGHAIGEGIGGWVFEWQTPQAIADVSADRRNQSAPIHQAGVASTLCVPMHVGEEVIGVIHAMSEHRRLFTVSEMGLLYTIANQSAVAVANALLFEQTREQSQEMKTYFKRVANAIGKALTHGNLPQILADISLELMRGDRCTIYQCEAETLKLVASSQCRATAMPDTKMGLGAGLAGWVAKRGQNLTIVELERDARAEIHGWIKKENLSSYLGIPIKSGRRTVGVLEVYTHEPREFSKEEVNLLASFTRRVRVADQLDLLLKEVDLEKEDYAGTE